MSFVLLALACRSSIAIDPSEPGDCVSFAVRFRDGHAVADPDSFRLGCGYHPSEFSIDALTPHWRYAACLLTRSRVAVSADDPNFFPGVVFLSERPDIIGTYKRFDGPITYFKVDDVIRNPPPDGSHHGICDSLRPTPAA